MPNKTWKYQGGVGLCRKAKMWTNNFSSVTGMTVSVFEHATLAYCSIKTIDTLKIPESFQFIIVQSNDG